MAQNEQFFNTVDSFDKNLSHFQDNVGNYFLTSLKP